jgi:hypothetical protein
MLLYLRVHENKICSINNWLGVVNKTRLMLTLLSVCTRTIVTCTAAGRWRLLNTVCRVWPAICDQLVASYNYLISGINRPRFGEEVELEASIWYCWKTRGQYRLPNTCLWGLTNYLWPSVHNLEIVMLEVADPSSGWSVRATSLILLPLES